LFVRAFTPEGHPLEVNTLSSPTFAKTQDEAMLVEDKFGVKLGGDPNCCPVDKTDLFKKNRIVKELPWNNNATTKELSQIYFHRTFNS